MIAPFASHDNNSWVMEGVSYKQQLRFAISGLCSRDLEAPSVAAARAVLRGVRDNAQHLRAALLDILAGEQSSWQGLKAYLKSCNAWIGRASHATCSACIVVAHTTWAPTAGIDAAPRHAARCRLQLAEYAVLECLEHQQLTHILPRLSQQVGCCRLLLMDYEQPQTIPTKQPVSMRYWLPSMYQQHHPRGLFVHAQANIVLAAHRQDAGCINSLAALLTSCMAKLLLEPQGSYAAIHGASKGSVAAHASREVVTADFLCEALLFPVINSTYRSVSCQQRRVFSQACVLLTGGNTPGSRAPQARCARCVCGLTAGLHVRVRRDPEQTRVSAGSVVLLGLFEVLKGHTDQPAVIDAVRRCLSLMLQLMGAGE